MSKFELEILDQGKHPGFKEVGMNIGTGLS